MAEGAALEMPYMGNRIAGSNPALSAIQSGAKSGLLRCYENVPIFRRDGVAFARVQRENPSLLR